MRAGQVSGPYRFDVRKMMEIRDRLSVGADDHIGPHAAPSNLRHVPPEKGCGFAAIEIHGPPGEAAPTTSLGRYSGIRYTGRCGHRLLRARALNCAITNELLTKSHSQKKKSLRTVAALRLFGDLAGTRTRDTLLKRQVLCLLSYQVIPYSIVSFNIFRRGMDVAKNPFRPASVRAAARARGGTAGDSFSCRRTFPPVKKGPGLLGSPRDP